MQNVQMLDGREDHVHACYVENILAMKNRTEERKLGER
jgi:hypothetical protein